MLEAHFQCAIFCTSKSSNTLENIVYIKSYSRDHCNKLSKRRPPMGYSVACQKTSVCALMYSGQNCGMQRHRVNMISIKMIISNLMELTRYNKVIYQASFASLLPGKSNLDYPSKNCSLHFDSSSFLLLLHSSLVLALVALIRVPRLSLKRSSNHMDE